MAAPRERRLLDHDRLGSPAGGRVRIAHNEMVAWLVEEFGFEKLDANQFLTQVSESPVANVCDPNYTFLAKVPKRYLPRVDAYGGVHAKLAAVAEENHRGR